MITTEIEAKLNEIALTLGKSMLQQLLSEVTPAIRGTSVQYVTPTKSERGAACAAAWRDPVKRANRIKGMKKAWAKKGAPLAKAKKGA